MCTILFCLNLNILDIPRFFTLKIVGQRESSEVYYISVGLGDSCERNLTGIPWKKSPGLIGNPR